MGRPSRVVLLARMPPGLARGGFTAGKPVGTGFPIATRWFILQDCLKVKNKMSMR